MVASTSLDVLPEDPTAYKTKAYWEERYKTLVFNFNFINTRALVFIFVLNSEDATTTFDWFKTYSDLKPLLNEAIPNRDAKILMLGCGNSSKRN
jgi:hypothetical protein